MADEWTDDETTKIVDNFNILTSLIQRCNIYGVFIYDGVSYPSLPIMIIGCSSTITESNSDTLISYFIHTFKPSQYININEDSLTMFLYTYIKYINRTCVKQNSKFDINTHISIDGEYIVYKSIIDYILPLLFDVITASITVSKDFEKIYRCGFTFNIRKIETRDLLLNSYRGKITPTVNGVRNFIGVL